MNIDSFTPIADTVNIASQGTTASAAAALGVPSGWQGGIDILVTNASDTKIHVKFGASDMAVADKTKDIPVLAGTVLIFGVGPKGTFYSAVTETGTATGKIYFTPGKGS